MTVEFEFGLALHMYCRRVLNCTHFLQSPKSLLPLSADASSAAGQYFVTSSL